MKKHWIAASFAVSMSVAGYAAAEDTGPGCGLGSMIFKGKSGPVNHVLAATTNGSFGNQTFAMSTGTLGCETSSAITSTASVFVDDNMETVARDMAMLMNIEAADRETFKQTLQASFDDIYTHENISSTEVLNNMAGVLEQEEALSKYFG